MLLTNPNAQASCPCTRRPSPAWRASTNAQVLLYWYKKYKNDCLLVQKYLLIGTKALAYWYKSTWCAAPPPPGCLSPERLEGQTSWCVLYVHRHSCFFFFGGPQRRRPRQAASLSALSTSKSWFSVLSVFLLYWYKSTNTDAGIAQTPQTWPYSSPSCS